MILYVVIGILSVIALLGLVALIFGISEFIVENRMDNHCQKHHLRHLSDINKKKKRGRGFILEEFARVGYKLPPLEEKEPQDVIKE